MKRSSQEKPKPASIKSDATKLKDMQKAYGISSKDITSKAKVSSTPTRTSFKSTSSTVPSGGGDDTTRRSSTNKTAANTLNSKRVKNSTGAAKTDSMSTSRRSGEANVKPSSKIIAASKANYAEKYGTSGYRHSTEQKNKTNAVPATTNRRISNNNTMSGSTTSSPYKTRSPPKISQAKSTSSTTSRLTTQKPPSDLYESEAASDMAEDGDYEDEDFEEDYESDFEEAMSSEGEPEEEEEDQQEIAKPAVGGKVAIDVEETSVADEDYDKSSSIREFEKLEKMMEVEEKNKEQQRRLSNGKVEVLKKQDRGSGEPAAGTKAILMPEESADEEEDDDEDDNSVPFSSVDKKVNAFPQTTGFSITTSMALQKEELGEQRERSSAIADRKSGTMRNGEMMKTSMQKPYGETSTQNKKRVNRGKVIQGMIKLDRVQVDIFHLAPYQYERFMAVFSGTDRLQSSTQTDQDKSEESAQTEPIEQTAKWTQKPPTWSTTSSSCDIRIVRQEALGVGSDEISEDLTPDDQKIYKQFDFLKNWEQLSKFILRASRKMLYVLEAEERIKLPSSSGNKGSLETIKMNRGLSVLSKLAMHTLACDGEFVGCANGTKQAAAAPASQDKTDNGNKKHTSKNLVTVWSLKEPSMPLYFLRVWGHVSALKVHMIGRIVVSGNRDGSLNVWNLDESMCYHSHYQEQVIRTPSVNTSCMMPTHILPIVGIEMFSESKNTFSLVSIDKEGLLITWSCLRSHDTLGESTFSQHSSAWSTIHMSVRYQIQLGGITRDHLQITCFSSYWDVDDTTTGFCFGTFNGYVGKGKVVVEGAGAATTTVEKYQERMDSNPKVASMDISRALNILAMGCEDGRCRLFELSRKKMVLSLGGKKEPIRVRWSGRRASVLYVALKDSLLIWDLLTSDMNPWKTIHLKDIQDFVLYSPPHKEYLVIISGNDLIISTPAEEVKPLTNREFARIQSYFSVLC